jgi:hypothetical protein
MEAEAGLVAAVVLVEAEAGLAVDVDGDTGPEQVGGLMLMVILTTELMPTQHTLMLKN